MAKKEPKRLPSLRLRAIACAGVGTYRYTYEGVVESMDPLAFAIFGLEEHFKDPKEVVGRNLTELFEYLHPVGEGRQQVERFGRVHGLERQFNTLRGQRKWVLADLWHIPETDGKPPLIEAVVRDISRQKQTEEQLRESEERWQQFFLRDTVPKLLIDPHTGEITDLNAAAEAFYGWTRAKMRARTADSLVHGAGDDAPPPSAEPGVREERHRRAEGEACPVIVVTTPLQWRGRPHILWTVLDQSARVARQTTLERNEQRFRRIAAADCDYLYHVEVRDGQAVSTKHEPGCEKVTGYTVEEFRDDPYLWFAMVWEEEREAVRRHAEHMARNESFEPIEHRIVRKDGVLRWVRNTPAPEYDTQGRLIAYDGLMRDITEGREAVEALREREQHFRAVFESGYHAMFVLSGDLQVLQCNSAAEQLQGMTREQFKTAPVNRRMPESAIEQMLHAFEVTAREGQWKGESQRYGADGRIIEVEVTATRFYIQGRLHFLVTLLDITERKYLEAELVAIKETLDLTLDAVVMLDPATLGIIYVNDGALSLLGLPRDQLLGRTPLDLSPEFSQQDLLDILEPLRTDPSKSVQLETKILHADGNLVPVEIFLQYADPPAGPGRFIALLRDISGRLRAESGLRESEANLARAQRIAHMGSWSHQVGSGTMKLSRGARPMFDLPDDQDEAPFPSTLEKLFSPVDWPSFKAALDACLRHAIPLEFEVHAVLPHGRQRFYTINAAAGTDAEGAVSEIHGTVQDITERKRAEEERLKLEAQMRQAQKLESLGVLAGGIAHDFNNILTAILGNAGLLQQDLPPEGPHRRRLADIEAAARRAAYLSQQMLSYSGRGSFVIRLVNLNDIVRETALILSASIPKAIQLTFDYDDAQPPVQADAPQISQLVINLVTNAAEAIGDGPGEITVTTRLVEVTEDEGLMGVDDDPIMPGPHVCLEVRDTGCGMTDEVKRKLFDPFFTTKFTGRGLGLAAVLGIVRAHYGALQVESAPGEGSLFRVLFPAAAGQAVAVDEAASPTGDFHGEGLVLLVDDEPSLRTVGKRMLERLGFTVITAEDGIEGVEKFKERHDEIACVVLDLVMPRMDGGEALQEMMRIHPGVRVVLCSGYSREEISARFTDQSVAGFLHKPFQMKQLAAVMQAALAAR